ncbi:hypothetical protein PR048_031418 [Dryococelus australis]|uniref:Uncharacterized protein n=1 Tax=Dryococelus australis TaxID=614101 RepID=A0ABQ9G578_9NEOP|nr:hypothetical protein PR048_031418 [Dryococelus australis]
MELAKVNTGHGNPDTKASKYQPMKSKVTVTPARQNRSPDCPTKTAGHWRPVTAEPDLTHHPRITSASADRTTVRRTRKDYSGRKRRGRMGIILLPPPLPPAWTQRLLHVTSRKKTSREMQMEKGLLREGPGPRFSSTLVVGGTRGSPPPIHPPPLPATRGCLEGESADVTQPQQTRQWPLVAAPLTEQSPALSRSTKLWNLALFLIGYYFALRDIPHWLCDGTTSRRSRKATAVHVHRPPSPGKDTRPRAAHGTARGDPANSIRNVGVRQLTVVCSCCAVLLMGLMAEEEKNGRGKGGGGATHLTRSASSPPVEERLNSSLLETKVETCSLPLTDTPGAATQIAIPSCRDQKNASQGKSLFAESINTARAKTKLPSPEVLSSDHRQRAYLALGCSNSQLRLFVRQLRLRVKQRVRENARWRERKLDRGWKRQWPEKKAKRGPYNEKKKKRETHGELPLTREFSDEQSTNYFRFNREQLKGVRDIIKDEIDAVECNATKPSGTEEKPAVFLRHSIQQEISLFRLIVTKFEYPMLASVDCTNMESGPNLKSCCQTGCLNDDMMNHGRHAPVSGRLAERSVATTKTSFAGFPAVISVALGLLGGVCLEALNASLHFFAICLCYRNQASMPVAARNNIIISTAFIKEKYQKRNRLMRKYPLTDWLHNTVRRTLLLTGYHSQRKNPYCLRCRIAKTRKIIGFIRQHAIR